MKRKLFVTCCSLGAGGAERVLSILSTPFSEEFDEVEYIMWNDAPIFYAIHNKVKVVSIEKECHSHVILNKMIWFRKYVRKNSPDLILSFLASFNMLTLSSLLFFNSKIVVAERIDPSRFKWGKFLRYIRNLLYHKAIGILTQTQSGKDYFSPGLKKKTEVIFNPVMMTTDEVASWDINKAGKVIVSAARLEPQKNQKMLIDAFARLYKKYPDYKLVIYGEGTERNNLEEYIVTKGLKDIVLLPGVSSQLWKDIVRSRMFVLSSDYEGMSNSLIEAMCLGIPCISTKVCGSVDLINNGENGFLINVSDTDTLYEKMCLLTERNDISMNISKNASKLYEALNVDVISKQWISYLNSKMI